MLSYGARRAPWLWANVKVMPPLTTVRASC